MDNLTDKISFERFVGIVNYVSKIVSNILNVPAPLRSLLWKNSEFACFYVGYTLSHLTKSWIYWTV